LLVGTLGDSGTEQNLKERAATGSWWAARVRDVPHAAGALGEELSRRQQTPIRIIVTRSQAVQLPADIFIFAVVRQI
jgi:hypothetical protein